MSQLNVNSIKDRTGENQPDIIGAAKAFVNFNGAGTVAIRQAFNVSGVTDNGVGSYTVNFNTPMPNVNYSAFLQASYPNGSTTNLSASTLEGGVYSTTAVQLLCEISSGASYDSEVVSVVIYSN